MQTNKKKNIFKYPQTQNNLKRKDDNTFDVHTHKHIHIIHEKKKKKGKQQLCNDTF